MRSCRLVSAALATLLAVACGSDSAPPVERAADLASAQAPPTRIISLAPHLTELAYSAGAGSRLVGVVRFSDFPAAAQKLPLIGDAFRLDFEVIAELSPDLVLAWESGNPVENIERLRALGYRVATLEPRGLDGIAMDLRRIGQLAGTGAAAERAAKSFEESLQQLRTQFSEATPIRVFYQVSDSPWLTVSDRHVIGEVLRLCGGRNIFGDLPGLTPSISQEAIVDAAPQVIIVSSNGAVSPDGLMSQAWAKWSSLPAVRASNLFSVNADQLSRPGVRILAGIREVCDRLGDGRSNLRKLTTASE